MANPSSEDINESSGPTFINKQTVNVGVHTPKRQKIYIAPYEAHKHLRRADQIYEVRGHHYVQFAGLGGPLSVFLPPKAAPSVPVAAKAPASAPAAPPAPVAPAASDAGGDSGVDAAADETTDSSNAGDAGDVPAQPTNPSAPRSTKVAASKGSGLKARP